MPAQDAELGAVVVGRDEEAAVHVGVPARLLHQQLPDGVDLRGRLRGGSAVEDGRPGMSGVPAVTIRNGSPAVW